MEALYRPLRGILRPHFLLRLGQEIAQRRIMLAQLATDEAKPDSREKWFVYSVCSPLPSKIA